MSKTKFFWWVLFRMILAGISSLLGQIVARLLL